MTEFHDQRPRDVGVPAIQQPAVISVVGMPTAHQTLVMTALEQLNVTVQTFRELNTFASSWQDTNGCLLVADESLTVPEVHVSSMLMDAGIFLPVVILAFRPDVRRAVAAMESGVFTYLPAPFAADELQSKVRSAMIHCETTSRDLARRSDAKLRYQQLTVKEREVVDRIMRGLTNREIAGELHVSIRAVEDRRSRIMRRMQAESLVQLVDLVRMADGTR